MFMMQPWKRGRKADLMVVNVKCLHVQISSIVIQNWLMRLVYSKKSLKRVKNKPLLNESQQMVLAQPPETLNAHTQRHMQVICTGARRKVSHFLNGTTGKLRGGKVTRFCEMREDRGQKRCSSDAAACRCECRSVRWRRQRAETEDERVFSGCCPPGLERGGALPRECVT